MTFVFLAMIMQKLQNQFAPNYVMDQRRTHKYFIDPDYFLFINVFLIRNLVFFVVHGSQRRPVLSNAPVVYEEPDIPLSWLLDSVGVVYWQH